MLIDAIFTDNLNLAYFPISNGANVNCYNGQPLICAVESKKFYFVKFLLDFGANPSIQSNKAFKISSKFTDKNILYILKYY